MIYLTVLFAVPVLLWIVFYGFDPNKIQERD